MQHLDFNSKIRWARKRFIAMAATYFLGVFNDNFFKQAVLLLAVEAGMNRIQGEATQLFSLPFILFSAWGGWFADRFAKRQVVIGAKILELVAMMFGAYGIISMSWSCIMAMVFVMALQSTLFGPALNGAIPELYPPEYVTRANAILKVVTTVAILAGMATAGFALDQRWVATRVPFGRLLVAIIVVAIAVFGVALSFGVFSMPASGSKKPFPWTGPLDSVRDMLLLKNDPLLLLAICCQGLFYFLSLLAILVINTLGVQELGLSLTATSLISVSLMAGVCAGSMAAARLTSYNRWTHVLAPALAGLALSLAGAGLLVFTCGKGVFVFLTGVIMCAGFFGGLFLIPVTSFIQIRPASDSKGRIIGVNNFFGFTCMLISGWLFPIMDRLFRPSVCMIILGVISCVAGLLITWILHSCIEKTGGTLKSVSG